MSIESMPKKKEHLENLYGLCEMGLNIKIRVSKPTKQWKVMLVKDQTEMLPIPKHESLISCLNNGFFSHSFFIKRISVLL
jgi:hypothetical protein